MIKFHMILASGMFSNVLINWNRTYAKLIFAYCYLQVEQQYPVGEVRIAVGYGACKDIFAHGSDIMGVMTPPSRTAHFNRVDSIEQLKEMYALFFSAGSAAE